MKKVIALSSLFLSILLPLLRTTIQAQEIPDYGHKVHSQSFGQLPVPKTYKVPENVSIAHYFTFLDSLVQNFNAISNYPINEHLLVRYNPWIMDTLASTDYHKMKEKDSFVYDQKKLHVLKKGQILQLPDSSNVKRLEKAYKSTRIAINIPEFKLRIYQDTVLLYTFPIRVGQNRSKYLAMGDRVTNLRTVHGTGHIVAHVKNPDYYNPATGKKYHVTKRDDEKVTRLPQIPWLETEINGIRNGQMIHPTTNPNTLGKAYSNGCIGTREGDAWIIYYHAPIGTKVHIRYDLIIWDEKGNEITLKDIYGYYQ
ncbi:hypothetical protein FGF1_25530 [Flavobacteriaceae bacterium GF1]